MAKKINGLAVETEFTEWAVEYDLNGETFVTAPTTDEEEARLQRAALSGTILMRLVFETSWADLDDLEGNED